MSYKLKCAICNHEIRYFTNAYFILVGNTDLCVCSNPSCIEAAKELNNG